MTHGNPDYVNAEMFNVSKTTAGDEFKHVRGVIKQCIPEVQLPAGDEVDALCRLFPGQHMVFGALDITESERARVSTDELKWHSGKLGAASMMTILIVDGRGRPLAWETGIKGHNNDVGAFKKSQIYTWLQQLNRDRLRMQKEPVYLLGDGGFPNCQWVRIPRRLCNITTCKEREEVREHGAARVIVENTYSSLKRFSTTDYTRRTPDTQEEMLDAATRLTTQKLIKFPLRKSPAARTLAEQKAYMYNKNKKQEIRFEKKVKSQTAKLDAMCVSKKRQREEEEKRIAKLDKVQQLFMQHYPVLNGEAPQGWKEQLATDKRRPCLTNFIVNDYINALVPIPSAQAISDHVLGALRRVYERVQLLHLDACNEQELGHKINAYLHEILVSDQARAEQEQLRFTWSTIQHQIGMFNRGLLLACLILHSSSMSYLRAITFASLP